MKLSREQRERVDGVPDGLVPAFRSLSHCQKDFCVRKYFHQLPEASKTQLITNLLLLMPHISYYYLFTQFKYFFYLFTLLTTLSYLFTLLTTLSYLFLPIYSIVLPFSTYLLYCTTFLYLFTLLCYLFIPIYSIVLPFYTYLLYFTAFFYLIYNLVENLMLQGSYNS